MRKIVNKIRIEEVARHAGVSSATVSRALNSPASVRPSTRKVIEEAINKLGYIPNASARALTLGRSETVGAVVPTLDNAIFSKGLECFQSSVAKAGYQLIVASCNYDPTIEETQIRNLLLRGVEAIALWGSSQTNSAIKLLVDRKIPYIHLGTLSPPRRGYACGFDNVKAIQSGVRHLLDQGHRHFCMLTGITQNNDRATSRLKGVRDLLTASSISLSDNQVREVPYNIGAARSAFEFLIRQNPKTTALICGQDVLAYGALLQATTLGLEIPKDLSIVGFDDLEFSQHLHPALTTIRYDAVNMWSKAAENLITRISGGTVDRLISSPTALIVRQSTGQPRRATKLHSGALK